MSSQEASSRINDAHYGPGSFAPVPPNVNDLLGASIPTATMDSSTLTGLRGAGAANFSSSVTFGDFAIGIKATCR